MRPADAPPPLLAATGLQSPRNAQQGLCVDFALYAGQLLHVQGANGSGKTSLLRMLAGLLRPLSGTLQYQGRNVRDDTAAYFAQAAFLGHANGLCGELTALENLRYALHVAGTPKDDAAIAQGLRQWRLEGCTHTPAARLSQGQGRRLALAAVVLGGKPLWLLDEPDAGLDAASLDQLWALLDAHLDAGGAAVVATHRLPGAARERTQTLNMDEDVNEGGDVCGDNDGDDDGDDYADADHAVSVGVA